MHRSLRALLALSLFVGPLPVGAQVPPDLVRLKDGGMLRGTIIELAPGDKVVIALPSGETRTVSMDDVQYAGAADAAPSAAPSAAAPREAEGVKPMVTVRTEAAQLALRSPDEALTWHVSGTRGVAFGAGVYAIAQGFDRLCTAPCEVEMPVGVHRLALSRDGGLPLLARRPVDIVGDGELVGRYEDNSTARVVMRVISIAGLASGALLTLLSVTDDDPELGTGFYVGVGLAAGGAITGMFAPADRVEVDYRPR